MVLEWGRGGLHLILILSFVYGAREKLNSGGAREGGKGQGREGAREGGRRSTGRGGGGEAITRGKANLIIDKPDMETCGLNKIQKTPGGLIWFP